MINPGITTILVDDGTLELEGGINSSLYLVDDDENEVSTVELTFDTGLVVEYQFEERSTYWRATVKADPQGNFFGSLEREDTGDVYSDVLTISGVSSYTSSL